MDLKRLSALHEKLNRQMKHRFDAYFSNTTLTSAQALTLEFIMEKHRHGDVFPKDIECFLEIKPSSVTSLIAGLERNGYLRRESSADDGRYVRLVPTKKALDMQQDISDRISHYTGHLYTGISEKDLHIFEAVLMKMTENTE